MCDDVDGYLLVGDLEIVWGYVVPFLGGEQLSLFEFISMVFYVCFEY